MDVAEKSHSVVNKYSQFNNSFFIIHVALSPENVVARKDLISKKEDEQVERFLPSLITKI